MAQYLILLSGIGVALVLLFIGGLVGYAVGAKEEKLERHLWRIKQRVHRARNRGTSGSIKAKTLEDAEREDRQPLLAAIGRHVPEEQQTPPTLADENRPGIFEP